MVLDVLSFTHRSSQHPHLTCPFSPPLMFHVSVFAASQNKELKDQLKVKNRNCKTKLVSLLLKGEISCPLEKFCDATFGC